MLLFAYCSIVVLHEEYQRRSSYPPAQVRESRVDIITNQYTARAARITAREPRRLSTL